MKSTSSEDSIINEITKIPNKADIYATLIFIINNKQILLIQKKRGCGTGKITGPGGKLESGETPIACAIRETEEELKITPLDLQFAGDNLFHFSNEYTLKIDVFIGSQYNGKPTETDEALPLWFSIDKIPYDKMWADNRYWIPVMLEKKIFSGRYLFEGENIMQHQTLIITPLK